MVAVYPAGQSRPQRDNDYWWFVGNIIVKQRYMALWW